MKRTNLFFFLAILCGLSVLHMGLSGCGIYSFKEKFVSKDSSRTVRVNFIENRAPYVNSQLSPNLTERLRLKISNQTKLTQTNNDKADIDISGTITDYSVSTAGVTTANGQQQSSINRLTVSVRISLNRRLTAQTEEFSVSRSFDFSANQSLQSAESTLLAEMVRNLSDEIFNRIFSTW